MSSQPMFLAREPGHTAAPASAPQVATASAPLLRLAQASVHFGHRAALQDISLAVHRGERIALVGPNGSGKTTLLRLLHGLIEPDQAQTRMTTPGGLRCAMLFQRPFLLNFSVQTNLRLAMWLGGVPASARASRVAEVLQRVGLQDEARSAACELSGGQQQRLAFARALALQPDLLFLDEPTSSLDPSAKREVEGLIDGLNHAAFGGIGFVMSSHNLGQVKRLASRVIFLHAGRLVVDLPVQPFFNSDLPAEAAQFLRGELPW